MNGFLQDYFPSVAAKQSTVNTKGNLYCQYDSQTLQLMTSVLFISGAICELTGTTGIVTTLLVHQITGKPDNLSAKLKQHGISTYSEQCFSVSCGSCEQ